MLQQKGDINGKCLSEKVEEKTTWETWT